MNPLAWSYRSRYLAGFLVCAGLMGFALYAQYEMHLDPCPLCIFQRIAVCIMGLVFLIGGLHAPVRKGARATYAILATLGGAWGIATAGRHLWLQTLPADQVPACGPGLGYLFDAFPFMKMLKLAFTGSGECAKVEPILGVPMPGWTLLWFIILIAWAWMALRSSDRSPTSRAVQSATT
ncbi:disulfide bond formation protein B [Luteibacter pinisoli]|uniref:Disulfide bond formation protein B n=1 Tax=Luteibacter pinisoli TaxID=2589080 RepID=A0A4Y5Z2D0_9GAMM|nr:disulfide bond formation protein B [Luteibacter pinisoli]QDE38638.1 disulfide bond formation protein B [Luteibacter pinisoli]